MNILYVGVMRDRTGWGAAAINYALALDAAGAHVVCRPLRLNSFRGDNGLPARYLELESRPSCQFDAVIQHVLPSQAEYNASLGKNCCLFASETEDFLGNDWADHLNLMDLVVVPNRQMVGACRTSGVKKPIVVVPHALDMDRFTRSHKPLPSLLPFKERGEFLFYTVGEFIQRKNFSLLLRAFHTEFDPEEPVRLVIKTSVPGLSDEDGQRQVGKFCEHIREGLRLRHHKPEIVITTRLTDEALLSLHAACDCFVLPSRGEAACQTGMDSLAMGKTPIVTDCTGFQDWLSDKEGWLVPAQLTPCFGAMDAIPGLFTHDHRWWEADLNCLRWAMREAYSEEGLRKEKARAGRVRACDFDFETVGRAFRAVLEA